MSDLTDTELIELVQSECCTDARCGPPTGMPLSESSQQRCQALREVWLVLGEWELSETDRDMWPRIEAEVHRVEGRLDIGEYGRRTNGALGEVWGQLDAWQEPQEKRDLWPRIEQAARNETGPPGGRFRRWVRRLLTRFGRRKRP